jgi:hypothetical protein
MNRVTALSLAFLALAVAASVWLLTSRSHPPADDAAGGGLAPAGERVGMTFAEWSVRSDGVLLADIDPGKGVSTDPRSFLLVPVKPDGKGGFVAGAGQTMPWTPETRGDTAGKLFALGFRVNTEGRAFTPPADPLWSEPIPRVDAAVDQVVKLKAKGSGATAVLTRRIADPGSVPYWNRRAIGFPSDDGRVVYVTPDAVVLPMEPAGAH